MPKRPQTKTSKRPNDEVGGGIVRQEQRVVLLTDPEKVGGGPRVTQQPAEYMSREKATIESSAWTTRHCRTALPF